MRRFFSRTRIIAGIVLALALIAVTAWLFIVAWRPSPRDFPLQGVYVSERQGAVDWYALHSQGVGFAYVTATIGAERVDIRFARNWADMFEAAVPRGAVHRFSLCQLARDQARLFRRTVPVTREALPAAVELHFDAHCRARPERRVVIGEIETFLRLAEAHTGKPMLLKIAPDFEHAYQVSRAIRRPLWAEQGFFPPEYLHRPWHLWQASRFRRITGVARPVNWVVAAQ